MLGWQLRFGFVHDRSDLQHNDGQVRFCDHVYDVLFRARLSWRSILSRFEEQRPVAGRRLMAIQLRKACNGSNGIFLMLKAVSLITQEVYKEQAGSALVEFAASAIVLFTLVFGIMECSRAVYVDHFIANVAQEATRYAMVRGASWTSSCASYTSSSCTATGSNITTFVRSLASAGITSSNLNVGTTWPGTDATGAGCLSSSSIPTNTVGCVVSVTVTYPFSFVSPLLPKNALSLSSTSEVTIVQ